MNLLQAHDVAIDIAKTAGERLRQGLKEHKTVSRKSTAVDLLTEHDQAAEAFIVARLRAAFPDHRLIAEEGSQAGNISGDARSPYVWYIDPLDGTNNFVHGYPVFSVSLALYEDDRALVGVIYDPMRDECFSAVAGDGAFLASAESTTGIQVSQADSLSESLLATGFPYDRHNSQEDNLVQTGAFLKKVLGVRRAGSASLDLAYVAAGRLDGYWEFKLSNWDVAAGTLLVQEAGGRITGIDGQPLHLASRVSLVASNGLIHPAMLTVLADAEG